MLHDKSCPELERQLAECLENARKGFWQPEPCKTFYGGSALRDEAIQLLEQQSDLREALQRTRKEIEEKVAVITELEAQAEQSKRMRFEHDQLRHEVGQCALQMAAKQQEVVSLEQMLSQLTSQLLYTHQENQRLKSQSPCFGVPVMFVTGPVGGVERLEPAGGHARAVGTSSGTVPCGVSKPAPDPSHKLWQGSSTGGQRDIKRLLVLKSLLSWQEVDPMSLRDSHLDFPMCRDLMHIVCMGDGHFELRPLRVAKVGASLHGVVALLCCHLSVCLCQGEW